MKTLTVLTLCLFLAGCSAKLTMHSTSSVQSTNKPKPSILLRDLKACSRHTRVYESTTTTTTKNTEGITLPNPPVYPEVSTMVPGQFGWLPWINSKKDGQLYVDSFTKIAPSRTERTYGIYTEYTPEYGTHVLMTKEGLTLDCSSGAFVVPDQEEDLVRYKNLPQTPIVGMFSTKAK